MAGVFTLYGIDQANPLSAYETDFHPYPASSTFTSQPGDMAVDVIATYACGGASITPGEGQTVQWSYSWQDSSTENYERGSTSTKLASGSTVSMSRGASGGCDWGYVAALFWAAGNATPTPTLMSSPTPTVTPTVQSLPSGPIWRSCYREASLGSLRSPGDEAGSQLVAMRVVGDPVPANNGVFYLLPDHLGSTNVVVDAGGAKIGELRYRAWGETRLSTGTIGTDYRYTGQREEESSTLD